MDPFRNPPESQHQLQGSKDFTSSSTSSPAAFLAHPLIAGASISFATGFALGTILFFFWRLAVKCCCESKPAMGQESGTSPTLFGHTIRSAQDLSFLLSDLPLPLPIIGRGGCGEVYKAELLTGGQTITIAIKRILHGAKIDATRLCEEESKLLNHRMRQIRSEIVTVGHMRHPNILRLLAHVPLLDCHYLVYEYMKNGSLHDILKSGEARKQLSWPCRHKIALGIAAGLEYIHLVHRPKVIHRDLKPANILLDDNLNARIADFGLAKVVPDAVSGAIGSNNVAGTLGYIAPEYYQKMSYTEKSDMYSFGMILAVLVTGMFPTDGFFQTTEELCMIGWVRRVINSDEPSEAIDSMMEGCEFGEEMLLVLKIACFCTYDVPNQRPNSRDVKCMLSQIKH